jgi:DNA mismatch repair protein MutS
MQEDTRIGATGRAGCCCNLDKRWWLKEVRKMERPRQHPDIVDPYRIGVSTWCEKSFVQDLSIQTLLESVPFHSDETRKLAMDVLAWGGTDMKTVEYRQDVLQDLVSSEGLLESVERAVSRLHEMGYWLWYFLGEPSLSRGIHLLKEYRDFINNPPDLSQANSKALKEVRSYIADIKASEEFKGLCGFMDTVGGLGGVVFRVTMDWDGTPATITAMELVRKDPQDKSGILGFFERLLGRRKFEEHLKTSSRPNEVGKVIQGLIDRQFVPIVKAYIEQIREIILLLEPLAFYAGLATYFISLKKQGCDICRPKVLPVEERRMAVKNARNPLLAAKQHDGQRVVPNGISHSADQNMFVITGPNNGGKTTHVRTVGLVQLMAQKGLFVTAESAEVSFVDGIYTHFVTPDDVTKGEGRYRNELLRVKEILETATPYSLVILDEPCGGTSYEEGCRQSMVVLDGIHKLGPATYYTTHMHPVAEAVDQGRYPAARNLSVECRYDGKKIKYTYKVNAGAANRSYGEEIARDIGLMPEKIEEMVSKRAERQGYEKIIRK